MDIRAADNNSLRIGAANRIVQLLQKLRYSNNENSAKRWIWELCQNAKDVCNSTGKVIISINYDEMQRKVFFRHKFRYKREVKCGLENATVSEIEAEQLGHPCKKYVFGMTEDNVSIYIALERMDDNMKIIPFSQNQSKLFCDFPLIGTEDFPFPVLISSPDFNPTEPWDGVFLTCKNTARIDEEIEVNRSIIEKACGLYEQLLEYVAKKKWDGMLRTKLIR
ncbi:MAG: hypothetical protein MJ248_07265 [Bacilli bacterium]|nr:hypothetical protein [Bacilli bacterium]